MPITRQGKLPFLGTLDLSGKQGNVLLIRCFRGVCQGFRDLAGIENP